MNELVLALPINARKCMRKNIRGKIKIASKSKSAPAIKLTVLVLLGLTILGFLTFDYKDISISEATIKTIDNAKVLFATPKLSSSSLSSVLNALSVTLALGVLSTFFGALIAVFAALLCAKNLSNSKTAAVVKGFVALFRAVPTILWVLIFTASAGLGSVAAVVGLTFHSAAFLIKAFSESFETIDEGTIEALKASGASYWQIVFQAVLPSSISYMVAWTFLRFEINFNGALAVGAAAGAGGIGYDLFMAGSFYFDLRELGFITYIIVAAVVLLEIAATKVKAKVR